MSVPIVYHYPARWDRLYRARQRCLMEAMSVHTPVVYLNEPEMTGKIVEAKRPTVERLDENIMLVRNAFGFRCSRLGRKMGRAAAAVDGIWLRAALRGLGLQEYIYWLAAVAPEKMWGLKTDRLIFDNHDPCFFPEHQAIFDQREAYIVKRARLVFASAAILLEKMKGLNPNSHLLPNAACVDDHHPDYTNHLPLPETLRGKKRPVIGYLGTFDWRMDYATLTEVVRRLPEYTFLLAGRVNQDMESNVRELRSFSNVIMPGALSQEEVNASIAAFDVGLIPFTAGEIGDGINPTKMWSYLMAGKPMVSTWLRETRELPEFVYAAKDVDDFVCGIRTVLSEESPARIARRLEFSMQNTYADRARAALTQIQATGLLT